MEVGSGLVTINGVFVQELVHNTRTMIRWRTHQITAFVQHLARQKHTKKSLATLAVVATREAGDADDTELRDLAQSVGIDPDRLRDPEWRVIKKRMVSSMQYRLKDLLVQHQVSGRIRETWDPVAKEVTTVWSDELVQDILTSGRDRPAIELVAPIDLAIVDEDGDAVMEQNQGNNSPPPPPPPPPPPQQPNMNQQSNDGGDNLPEQQPPQQPNIVAQPQIIAQFQVFPQPQVVAQLQLISQPQVAPQPPPPLQQQTPQPPQPPPQQQPPPQLIPIRPRQPTPLPPPQPTPRVQQSATIPPAVVAQQETALARDEGDHTEVPLRQQSPVFDPAVNRERGVEDRDNERKKIESDEQLREFLAERDRHLQAFLAVRQQPQEGQQQASMQRIQQEQPTSAPARQRPPAPAEAEAEVEETQVQPGSRPQSIEEGQRTGRNQQIAVEIGQEEDYDEQDTLITSKSRETRQEEGEQDRAGRAFTVTGSNNRDAGSAEREREQEQELESKLELELQVPQVQLHKRRSRGVRGSRRDRIRQGVQQQYTSITHGDSLSLAETPSMIPSTPTRPSAPHHTQLPVSAASSSTIPRNRRAGIPYQQQDQKEEEEGEEEEEEEAYGGDEGVDDAGSGIKAPPSQQGHILFPPSPPATRRQDPQDSFTPHHLHNHRRFRDALAPGPVIHQNSARDAARATVYTVAVSPPGAKPPPRRNSLYSGYAASDLSSSPSFGRTNNQSARRFHQQPRTNQSGIASPLPPSPTPPPPPHQQQKIHLGPTTSSRKASVPPVASNNRVLVGNVRGRKQQDDPTSSSSLSSSSSSPQYPSYHGQAFMPVSQAARLCQQSPVAPPEQAPLRQRQNAPSPSPLLPHHSPPTVPAFIPGADADDDLADDIFMDQLIKRSCRLRLARVFLPDPHSSQDVSVTALDDLNEDLYDFWRVKARRDFVRLDALPDGFLARTSVRSRILTGWQNLL